MDAQTSPLGLDEVAAAVDGMVGVDFRRGIRSLPGPPKGSINVPSVRRQLLLRGADHPTGARLPVPKSSDQIGVKRELPTTVSALGVLAGDAQPSAHQVDVSPHCQQRRDLPQAGVADRGGAMSHTPTVLELFSGCGGAALGLHRAGWQHHACIEWDKYAAATLLEAGLPGVHGDVRKFDYQPYTNRTDLMWASPPCQAGSTAGKRKGAGDDRNGWPWTMDAIDAVKPTWFLAENVLGWTYHRKGCKRRSRGLTCIGCYWERWILPELRSRFAFVGWWRVNAANYGTPQHRRRVILWAGPLPLSTDPPTPSHLDPDDGEIPPGVKPWVSIREAIGDTLNRGSCDRRACYPCDGQHGRACTEPHRYDRPSPTVVTVEEKGTRARFANGFTFNGGPDRASDTAFLVAGIRRIDIEEGLLLQGFPVDWPLQGTKHARYRQVGNAVPPQLSEVLGRTIRWADGVYRGLGADPEAMADLLRRTGQTLPQAV